MVVAIGNTIYKSRLFKPVLLSNRCQVVTCQRLRPQASITPFRPRKFTTEHCEDVYYNHCHDVRGTTDPGPQSGSHAHCYGDGPYPSEHQVDQQDPRDPPIYRQVC